MNLGILASLMAGLALAGPPSNTTSLPPADKPVVTSKAASGASDKEGKKSGSTKPERKGDQSLVSLNIADHYPAAALRFLSEQTGVNLVLLTPSETKISLTVKDVPFLEVLKHICALTDLTYLKVDSTYVVATEERLKKNYPKEWLAANPDTKPSEAPKPEPVELETYTTNYVSSTDLAGILAKLFPEGELSVIAGPGPSNPSIANQDASSKTGESSVVMTKEDAVSDTGSRVLLLRGSRAIINSALEVAKRLDTPKPQVSIGVTIYDISNQALKDVGLSWSFSDVNISEQNPDGIGFGSFSRAPQTFNAVLKALESSDKAKLLASPNVSVIDGSRALILIGDKINFPVLIGYSQANTPIFDKETERVGIYLQVAANVSTDNMITLSLYPQVSTVSGFLEVNGASYPQISTREAQTTLRVASGETIVMGGMLKDEEINHTDEVPLLSKIPLFGELFRHRKTTKTSSQVIITITPIVIKPTTGK